MRADALGALIAGGVGGNIGKAATQAKSRQVAPCQILQPIAFDCAAGEIGATFFIAVMVVRQHQCGCRDGAGAQKRGDHGEPPSASIHQTPVAGIPDRSTLRGATISFHWLSARFTGFLASRATNLPCPGSAFTSFSTMETLPRLRT